jgi:hypothetical protein
LEKLISEEANKRAAIRQTKCYGRDEGGTTHHHSSSTLEESIRLGRLLRRRR